jgi:hypothetical protein
VWHIAERESSVFHAGWSEDMLLNVVIVALAAHFLNDEPENNITAV